MLYDSIYPARVLIVLMKTFGIWNFRGQSYDFFYRIYGRSLHSVFTFFFIFAMFVNVAQTETIDDFADALYMTLTEAVLLVKIINIFIISHRVVEFLKIIEWDSESQPRNGEELRTMEEYQKSFMKLRDIYIGSCVIMLCLSDVGTFLEEGYKVPFPCWIPFDYKNSKNYPYAFAYVAIAMGITGMTNATMDLLQAYFLFQMAAYYKLIALRLKNYGSRDYLNEWKRIIRLHSFVESMVLRCQDIISVPVFAQVVISAFIIGFTVYQLQKISLVTDTANFISLLMFAMIMALQIYFPCYYGNEVTINADALTNALYSSNWTDLSAESRKMIFVYMEYLKRPIHVKAGQFFTIGIKVFTKTINNAYSLFALLLNIKHE